MKQLANSKPRNFSDLEISGSRKSILRFSRHSQEEMVGFVLIIVLVAIIGIIFLALSIRKPSLQLTSSEVNGFLYSLMPYTTSCYQLEPLSFKELVIACQENKRCENERKACEILNETIVKLIEVAFPIGDESKYKAYMFKVYKNNETFYSLRRGEGKNFVSGEIPIYGLGNNAYVKLELYY